MQLIPQWRQAWRMTSVNLPAIGLAILALLEVIPDAVLSVYATLPADIRATLPEEVIRYAGYAIIAIGAASRIVRQRSLDRAGSVQESSGPVSD